jgi:hypothetical protein
MSGNEMLESLALRIAHGHGHGILNFCKRAWEKCTAPHPSRRGLVQSVVARAHAEFSRYIAKTDDVIRGFF